MKPIPYGRQEITPEDIAAVTAVLQADYLTGGPRIQGFEEAFAKYVGAKYAVAVSSGTAALHLSAMALGVKPGHKVITTPNTFAATANCVLYCGGEVDLVDMDPATLTLDLELTHQRLASSPRGTYQGIIPVDFGGHPVNMEAFRRLADEFGCWLLEDACHAPGGYFNGSDGKTYFCGSGTWADLAIFSFHPVKHIACGEGGMITTNNETFYQQLLALRTHGITRDRNLLREDHGGWYYEMQTLGFNYRLTDIQAALGISQLSRAATNLERRRILAQRYEEAFSGSPVKTPKMHEGHAWHLYAVQVSERKKLYDYLRAQNIYSQIHYIPIHYQPFYQNLGWSKGDFPHTEKYYDAALSLPLFPSMTDEQQSYVIEKVLGFF